MVGLGRNVKEEGKYNWKQADWLRLVKIHYPDACVMVLRLWVLNEMLSLYAFTSPLSLNRLLFGDSAIRLAFHFGWLRLRRFFLRRYLATAVRWLYSLVITDDSVLDGLGCFRCSLRSGLGHQLVPTTFCPQQHDRIERCLVHRLDSFFISVKPYVKNSGVRQKANRR